MSNPVCPLDELLAMRREKAKRIFFALWPQDTLRQSLNRAAHTLALQAPARRVADYNLHLTLHFIGNVSLEQLGCMKRQARKVRAPGFDLSVDRQGCFSKAAVGWLGCSEVPLRLRQLHQELGRRLFMGKARCSGCHAGANFTDESLRNNGVTPGSTDDGRMQVTGRQRDRGLFKVPTLRGINNTAPYMHNGSIATIEQVVDAYIDASTANAPMKDTDLLPIELSNAEKSALIEYLKAL